MFKRSFNPDSRLPKPAFQRTCSVDRQSGGQVSGRKIILLLLIGLFINTITFADYRITRGPDIGEIYFIGPTATGEGIYHSTDFGETAVCVDSTLHTNLYFLCICADLTPGVLYGYTMPENLYISYSYGQQGNWIFRSADISYLINSGVTECYIYSSIMKHSENYGIDFINHSCQGFFGNLLNSEIDNNNGVCYAIIHRTSVTDSVYLCISYNNFDSLQIQNVYNVNENPIRDLSRGTENGELYNFADAPKKLKYSSDYGENWELHNVLNYGLDYKDMVGGRQEGEVYIYGYYEANMLTIEHIYIFHSTDYGKTFTVFHPFSKGEEPLVTNFSSGITEGSSPLTIQFCNYSVGDIQSYEWDFDNDGNIDSYEEEPEYTYQDTGYYSVKLTIYNGDESDEFLREDYIHITSGQDCEDYNIKNTSDIKLNNYPNSFKTETVIKYRIPNSKQQKINISIYNIKGELIRGWDLGSENNFVNNVVWNGCDKNNIPVSSGIYLCKLNINNKIVRTKKLLLLK